MEERRLVKSGLSSFTISLPKEWVMKNKLGKKSVVYLVEQEDQLVIHPKIVKQQKEEEKVLLIDSMPTNQAVRHIIESYLKNSGNIKIKGKTLRQKLDPIKNIIMQCAGLEVIEETGEMLVLKDFIDTDEIVLPNIIRRNDNVVRSMFLDIFTAFDSRDDELCKAVYQRDKEVNKLSFLVYKCLNYLALNPQETIHHGIRAHNLMHMWQLNNNLEKVGDELKRMALLIPNLKISASDLEQAKSILHVTYDFYTNVMTAIYTNNLSLADEYSGRRATSFAKCDEFLKTWKDINGRQIISRIKYLITIINDISRLVHYLKFDKPVGHPERE